MKQQDKQPTPAMEQVKELQAKKEKTQDPALKAAIDKKIELLKTGKDIKKQ